MKTLKKLYQKIRCYKIVYDNVLKRSKYNDRRVLEQIIIPHVLGIYDPKKILDVGREDYEGFYNKFFTGRELWTLDYDKEREEFGSPKHHITDDVANIGKHFKDEYFDFILINGVLGWGLNDREKIEGAFSGLDKVLAPGGVLIVGWNNFDDRQVPEPKKIKALKKLKRLYFKPLKAKEFECDNGNHTYSFFIKR